MVGKEVFVILEFTHEYCKYCLKLSAIIDKISYELKEHKKYKIHFGRINLDKNDNLIR